MSEIFCCSGTTELAQFIFFIKFLLFSRCFKRSERKNEMFTGFSKITIHAITTTNQTFSWMRDSRPKLHSKIVDHRIDGLTSARVYWNLLKACSNLVHRFPDLLWWKRDQVRILPKAWSGHWRWAWESRNTMRTAPSRSPDIQFVFDVERSCVCDICHIVSLRNVARMRAVQMDSKTTTPTLPPISTTTQPRKRMDIYAFVLSVIRRVDWWNRRFLRDLLHRPIVKEPIANEFIERTGPASKTWRLWLETDRDSRLYSSVWQNLQNCADLWYYIIWLSLPIFVIFLAKIDSISAVSARIFAHFWQSSVLFLAAPNPTNCIAY